VSTVECLSLSETWKGRRCSLARQHSSVPEVSVGHSERQLGPGATCRFKTKPVSVHRGLRLVCLFPLEIICLCSCCRSSMCLFTMPSWRRVYVGTQPYQCVSSEPFTTTSADWTHRPTPARLKTSSRWAWEHNLSLSRSHTHTHTHTHTWPNHNPESTPTSPLI